MNKLVGSLLLLLLIAVIPLSLIPVATSELQQLIDPFAIPKFVNQLDQASPVFVPTNITDNSGKLIRQEYTVKVSEFTQQILPTHTADGSPTNYAPTKIWGYEGEARNALTGENLGSVASTPGCTFEAIQGIPVQVKWVNNLMDANGNPLTYMVPVDPTLHWANPKSLPMDMTSTTIPAFPPGYAEAQTPVPIVTHLHGGEDQSTSDGGPDSWWTADGEHGPEYTTAVPTDANAAVYIYPNEQQPTTLWYHDHALGLTRLNVLSGLAGFYIIRNSDDPIDKLLPSGENEMPLVIQDRSFLTDGSLYYPTQGVKPSVHSYWQSTFLGNTIVVNGKAWPNMNVKQGQYRFRILDGSNSRFYQIQFSNSMSFTQIGSDGGFLKAPAQITTKLIAPAERIDILVDFSNIPVGTKIILENTAIILGGQETPQTTGQIMQFTVTDEKGFTPQTIPTNLNPTLAGNFPTLSSPNKQRVFTLIDVADQFGSSMMLLDGQKWSAPISEKPEVGSTEDWTLVNPSMEAHPIHVHLVQFQVTKRQNMASATYLTDWINLNGYPPLNHSTLNLPSLDRYLKGASEGPAATEQGWKDTVVVNAGEVVTIRLRWTEQNGNPFPFDATIGPGYVWHCHILEHEDNEMMRPYVVVSSTGLTLETIVMLIVAIVIVVIVAFLVLRRLRNLRKERT